MNFSFTIRRISLLALLGVWCLCTVAAAQEPDTGSDQRGSQKTELGIRQKLVQRKMVELEKKFTVVAEKIRDKNPQRADLLIQTYQQSKEQSLTRKMDEVGDLLNDQKYNDAEERLDEVVSILESLIRLLTNEKEKPITPKDEMKMLEKFKQKIEQQLQQQRQKTKETEKATNKPEALDHVAAQIKALDGLIEKQNELIDETAKNKDAAAKLKQLDKIADKQFEIRKATLELKKNIAGEKNNLNKDGSFKDLSGAVPSNDKLPSAKKSAEDSGPGSDQSEGSPGEEDAKSADAAEPTRTPDVGDNSPSSGDVPSSKSPEGSESASPPGAPSSEAPSGDSDTPQPGQQQSPSGSQQEPSGGQSPEESSDSGQQPPSESSPPPPAQPGQEELDKASEHQKRAEEKLGSGKPGDAQREQKEALKEMQQALSKLKKEERRIQSLPPEVLEQLAKEQRRDRDKTLDLIEEMEKAPKANPEQGEQSPSESPQQPGQQEMSDAQEAQGKAAQSMEQGDSDQAQQQQKKAEQKMENALEEIEDRLSQLREETNEEKLARLEARFQEMFDRQTTASVMTIEIEDKRANLGRLRHRDQLLVLRLATEEFEIRELAQQAYDVLLEDGTSIVFPEVVQDLRADLETAAGKLQTDKTDQYTQLIQKEVETTILDLLDALAEAKKKGDSGGGGGGGGQGGKQPLLKQSAELKILRMRQRRLNRRTLKLEAIRSQPEMQQTVEAEILEAAQLQKKILEMTDNIMKKSQ